MLKFKMITIIGLLVLYSCGRSTKKVESTTESPPQIAKKTHLELVEEGRQKNKIYLDKKLEALKLSYSQEKEKLDTMGNVILGKTSPARFREILDQNEKVKSLEIRVSNLKEEIKSSDSLITYQFQENPTSVFKELVLAIEQRDFQKLKNLCDPYEENDSISQQICWLPYNSEKQIEEISARFVSAKIIDQSNRDTDKYLLTVQNEDAVSSAFKIVFINRQDRWYLFKLENF